MLQKLFGYWKLFKTIWPGRSFTKLSILLFFKIATLKYWLCFIKQNSVILDAISVFQPRGNNTLFWSYFHRLISLGEATQVLGSVCPCNRNYNANLKSKFSTSFFWGEGENWLPQIWREWLSKPNGNIQVHLMSNLKGLTTKVCQVQYNMSAILWNKMFG